ncbi:DOPA-like domain-containing protein [Jackrogersella minutella]|nr:DOPA-like domain-containing protein [Jackrogersella minutella]
MASSSYVWGEYTYPSPLKGYENAPPLSEEKNEDGKSFKNPVTGTLSKAYSEFPDPLEKGRRGGFDVHIYYLSNNDKQTRYAKELWERIRREFPELRIYRVWDKPVGPHPIAMFEVNLFTPAQFGAFIAWLAIYRGPLSALIHPNTVEDGEGLPFEDVEYRNHSQRAIWMGEKIPLDLDIFHRGE